MERYGRIKKTFLISMRKGAVSLQKPQLGKYKYIQVYIDWSKPQLDNMLSVHHVSLYARTEVPFSHHCLHWSLITYGTTARQPPHALASKGNRRFMQTCAEKQIELYANATPASKTAMQNVFPEMHGTHARAGPARRAKPCQEEKVHMCI